jgi:DNA-binding transcriptional LysR family regulator
MESLDHNEVDFALVSVPPNRKDIEHLDLLANHLYLVGSGGTDTKLNQKKALQDFPLIYREKGSATRQIMEDLAAKNNLPLRKRLELTSNEAVKQSVLAGLGYSVMPLIGIHNELERKELQIIPIKPFPIRTQWQLIWLKDKEFSPVAKSYLQFLKREKNAILKQKFKWLEQFN